MSLSSLHAWGHMLSSQLKLKIRQTGVVISIILSHLPSRLSDPSGFPLLIDNNNCLKPFPQWLYKKLKSLHLPFIIYTWMCSVSVCFWHFIPKFAFLANEKKVIKVVVNISGFCDEWAFLIKLMTELSLPFFPQNYTEGAAKFFLLSFFI
jgi:hypothetical protein